MKLLSFYKSATWGLLFLNIGLIACFLLTRPPGPGRGHDRNFLKRAITIMKLDEEQKVSFSESATKHGMEVSAINEQQRDLLKAYLNSLTDTTKVKDNDAILDQVQSLERQKVEVTYQHFQEIKLILKPGQIAHFEVFMNEALEALLLESKKSPTRPQDF